MKMTDIRTIASARGLAPGRMTKLDLVRTLQREEGHTDCFQTGEAKTCGQDACLWRNACA